ncbi:uncharacterized protein PG998_008431 [Apiospora kogelbergensis]|uniref:Uncharacterized protein n=1 Tax=Apiospora kogelbergensis TaxID=1337665 RepID=A0AAW0QLA9_9PEZI
MLVDCHVPGRGQPLKTRTVSNPLSRLSLTFYVLIFIEDGSPHHSRPASLREVPDSDVHTRVRDPGSREGGGEVAKGPHERPALVQPGPEGRVRGRKAGLLHQPVHQLHPLGEAGLPHLLLHLGLPRDLVPAGAAGSAGQLKFVVAGAEVVVHVVAQDRGGELHGGDAKGDGAGHAVGLRRELVVVRDGEYVFKALVEVLLVSEILHPAVAVSQERVPTMTQIFHGGGSLAAGAGDPRLEARRPSWKR